jgi:hypothetical protein
LLRLFSVFAFDYYDVARFLSCRRFISVAAAFAITPITTPLAEPLFLRLPTPAISFIISPMP